MLVLTCFAPPAALAQRQKLSDREIRFAVESEWIASEAGDAHNVNVSTLDGTAKPHGPQSKGAFGHSKVRKG